MQVAAGYVVSPGVCCSCGTGDTKVVIDVGTEIPGPRRYHVFLCGECAINAGQTAAPLMGYRLERLDPDAVDPAVLQLQVRDLELKLAAARELLEDIADYAGRQRELAAAPL